MLTMLVLTGLQVAVTAPTVAATSPKVAIIVGPGGSQTSSYLKLGRSAAAEARRYTSNVVEVFTPRATWSRVKAAMTGASVVVYIGQGRGYPSRYTAKLAPTTQDGFGLNPVSGHGNSTTRYYGEAWIRKVHLAANAVVVLSRVPYASGMGEDGRPAPTLAMAKQRISNYAAGFLAAGAAAVIADRHYSATYYVRAIFTNDTSLAQIWRSAPSSKGRVLTYTSSRGRGVVVMTRKETWKGKASYYRSIVGRPSTSTSAVRSGAPVSAPPSNPNPPPNPVNPPPPSVPNPGSALVYGSAINADTKAQVQVGGVDSDRPNNQLSHRFRASTTSALQSVRFAQRGGTGYSAGGGGTMRVSVQADDGSGRPSGTDLASATYAASNPSGSWNRYDKVTFASPATLTKGKLYHIVFTNTNSAPRSNYISVNETYVYGSVLSPRQPEFPDSDYAVMTTQNGSWAVQGQFTADMDVAYANGMHDGEAYYQVEIGMYGTVSGTSDLVREHFTVSGGNRTISHAAVRVRRSSGSSPLVLSLQSSTGAIIDSVNIPASSVAASAPGGDNGGQVWAAGTFGSSHTLANGSTYSLVLSTASGTTYTATPIHEGGDLGFGSYVFGDGSAQETTNGSTWADIYQWGQFDLQFYFW